MTGKDQRDSPLTLASFGDGLNVAIVGATGGIGRALVDDLARCRAVARIFGLSRSAMRAPSERLAWHRLDLEDEPSISDAASAVRRSAGRLDIVVVATGILHDSDRLQPEKTWRALDPAAMERAFRLNSIGPALVAKHFLPLLAADRKSVFAALSARVGSIEDNRLGGWHSYRASKAALNMLIRTLSVELARRNPHGLCVALHPGTVDTALSRPFQARVPAGKLFPAARSARHLLEVLDALTPSDSGQVFAWDGSRIPF